MMKPGFKIEKMFAFVATDDDGTEGVCGMSMPDKTWAPMVGADKDRIESYRPYVQAISNATGKVITLTSFETRVDLEKIGPQK